MMKKQTLLKGVICLATMMVVASSGWSQEDEEFDAPVPPPQDENFDPPPAVDNPPPPQDFGGGGFNAPPPAMGNLPTRPRLGGGTPPPLLGSGAPSGGSPSTSTPLTSGKVKFSDAQPEDITDENFPDMIDSFDYPNADIREVVKAISKLTGKNFILDNNVAGKITIIAPTQITVAEAYRAFLSALAINKFTVVPSGKFLKIRNSRVAQRDNIETYAGSYFPNTDQMITRIFKLKYISAEQVSKDIRGLTSQDGEIYPYPATNALIISDYGTSIERIQNIMDQLDVPGFEEKLAVVRIQYAKSKDISDLLDQIINKENRSAKGSQPRFSRPIGRTDQGSGKGAENYSLVVSDDRTNSIIVVGNNAGIEKVRELIKKLDFPLRAEDAGGVYVYYVRHGEAEQIANVLNGIAKDTKTDATTPGRPNIPPPPDSFGNPIGGATGGDAAGGVFGGEVKVAADKVTNSLIVTASRQDYDVVKNLLARIDIPRDQVFVKTIIMEMNASNENSWSLNYFQFNPDSNGIGRVGFGSGDLASKAAPGSDNGAILGFGSGRTFDLTIAGQQVTVPSTLALVNLFKKNLGGNILSQPQILALDNEEAEIEVGSNIQTSSTTTNTNAGVTQTPVRENATLKLNITPFISPDSDKIRMKIVQTSKLPAPAQGNTAEVGVTLDTRNIKTVISLESGDTAVLGGLMQDREAQAETKVPLLGDIPILGWLFKSRSTIKAKSNLMVFITPKIIRNEKDNDDVLMSKINERIQIIQKNFAGRDPHGEIIDNLPRKSRGKSTTKQNEEFSEEPATETF